MKPNSHNMLSLPIIVLAVLAIAVVVPLSSNWISAIGINPFAQESKIQNLKPKYYGDTLYQSGGKTYILEWGFEDADITSMENQAIITYQDTMPIDTCVFLGNVLLENQGVRLKAIVGIDTLYYSITHLPKKIYAERNLKHFGFKEHQFKHSFELSDSSWNCDFAFYAELPDAIPSYIFQIMSSIMSTDIQGLFYDDKGPGKLLKEYYGIKSTKPGVRNNSASLYEPEQIARHYAQELERLYRKEFDGEYERGPKYDYSFTMTPEWKSASGRYITYRIYTYYYAMGAHGFPEEYYLTFDNHTGHILDFRDIFKSDKTKEVTTQLDSIFKKSKIERGYSEDVDYKSGLEEEDLSSDNPSLLKEKSDSVYYPRPALTDKGIVFSYQPYEAGCFADGVLHLILQYAAVSKSLKLSI